MQNKKLFILLIIILFISIIYLFSPNFSTIQKPIITLKSYSGTTVYTIEFYKKYAISSSTTGGFTGMIDNGSEKIKYDGIPDFNNIKEQVKNSHQAENFIDPVYFLFDNKEYTLEVTNEITQSLLKHIDKIYVNPMSILKKH